jgi:hypothetical protein
MFSVSKRHDAEFTGASMRDTVIVGVLDASGCIFRDADLSGAALCDLRTETGQSLDLTGAKLANAAISLHADSAELTLTGADMIGCRIEIAQALKPADKRQTLLAFLDRLTEQQRFQVVLDEDDRKLVDGPPPVEGKCFVATAACGNADAEEVVVLRAFRDMVLRRTWAGQIIISVYENVSPKAAVWIGRCCLRRRLARSLIVRPAAKLIAGIAKRGFYFNRQRQL